MKANSPFRPALYNQLEADRPDKRGLSPVNWIILFFILLSLVLYTVETERDIEMQNRYAFVFMNFFVLLAFGVEFLCRLYAIGFDERFRGWRGLCRYARFN